MNSNSVSNSASIYFKVAHTGENAMFNIPLDICMKNFNLIAKNKACSAFNINENCIIEVVEAGQGGPNLRGEDAPAIVPDSTITFREKYNGNYNIAFYIRVVQ